MLYPESRNRPNPRLGRHRLSTVLAIAAASVLYGMRGYQAIWEWAEDLGQNARRRFECRYQNKRYIVPSLYVIRDVLVRVDPEHIDRALQRWNQQYAQHDESLAIDGKTMCNSIDDQGYQTHIMSAVGHTTKICHTQKKVGSLPAEGNEETKRTNEIKTAIPLLGNICIQGKTITTDALLAQHSIADYI